MNPAPEIAVMMSTYNGATYLVPQLESILQQASVRPRIFVRDDDSEDETIAILERYSKEYPDQFAIFQAGDEGNVGVYHSWDLLLRQVPRDFDYYAISDQDDIWLPGKLNAAVEGISEARAESVLATCNTLAVNEHLAPIREYDFSSRKSSLGSMFARYSIPAHAMVFNHGVMKLIDSYDLNATPPSFTLEQRALLTTIAVGGIWIRDTTRYVLWRRVSGTNVTAAGGGLRLRISSELSRFRDSGTRTGWANALLSTHAAGLTPESREFLSSVVAAAHGWRGRLALARSSSLSTGVPIFDITARLRALLPNW